MNITVADSGACLKTISVEVQPDEIEKKFRANVRSVGQQVAVPGFRAGKVPPQIIEKKYGEYIGNQVRDELLKEAVEEARTKHGLDMLTQPEVETLPDIQRGQPYAVEIKVEVRPEFELPEYRGMDISAPRAVVTDTEISTYLKHIQMSQGQLHEIPEGEKISATDILHCMFILRRDGKALQDPTDGTIEAGSATILGIPVPEAAAKLVGIDPPKEGDVITERFSATVPADYPVVELGGSTVEIEMTIFAAQRPEYPELDQAMLDKLGMGSVEELRNKVKEMLASQKGQQIDNNIAGRLLARIVSQVNFEIPAKYAENRLGSMLSNEAYRAYSAGMAEADVEALVERRKAELPGQIENRLRESFVIDAIAKRERIYVLESDLHREIEAMAAQRRVAPSELYQQLNEQGMLTALRANIRRDKVLRELVRRAKVSYTGGEPEIAQAAESEA